MASESALEMTQRSLDLIARLEPAIGAFSHLLSREALTDAEAADARVQAGGAPGPLHGVTVAVKDNIDTARAPTTAGVAFRQNAIPSADAHVVQSLRAAGAIVVGKATMHELALGGTSQNLSFGPCRNPWNLDCTPSGSSGGSAAAVAAGMVRVSLGTDTGGSIRNPAAVTGVTGVRPTPGLVSLRGVLPLSWTLDTVGPLARGVDDVAAVLECLAGFDDQDPRSRRTTRPSLVSQIGQSVDGLRLGIAANHFFDGIAPGIESSVRGVADILADEGVEVVDVNVHGAESVFDWTGPVLWAEAWAALQGIVRGHLHELPARVQARLEAGARVTGAEYATGRQRARSWRRSLQRLFDEVDVVLTPTTAATAPPASICEEVEDDRALTRLTFPWSVWCGPSLSMPCGFDGHRLPIGAQLVGRPFDDGLLIRLAARYQARTRWHMETPEFPLGPEPEVQ